MPERSITRSKLVLAEGRDEEHFLASLLRHLAIHDIEVHSYQGKDNLRRYLIGLMNTPGFAQVESIGVVRDADNNAAAAFQSVQGNLTAVGLPVPEEVLVAAGTTPRVTVFIMPGNADQGALEDLCLSALENDPAIGCVSDFMECIHQVVTNVPGNLSKAKMHAFLASREDPELRLGEAAQRGYLPWGNPAFNHLTGFVRSL